MDSDTRWKLARFTVLLRRFAIISLIVSCCTVIAAWLFGLSQSFLLSSSLGVILALAFEGIGWNVQRIMRKHGVDPHDGSLL